jgi:hypothetical protein
MVLEVAMMDVKTGQTADFEAAFQQAALLIASIPGYVSHELQHLSKIPSVMCCWHIGRPSKRTRIASANQRSTKNGNACSIFFMIYSPPSNSGQKPLFWVFAVIMQEMH